jgi:hypothetical protein
LETKPQLFGSFRPQKWQTSIPIELEMIVRGMHFPIEAQSSAPKENSVVAGESALLSGFDGWRAKFANARSGLRSHEALVPAHGSVGVGIFEDNNSGSSEGIWAERILIRTRKCG